MEAVTTPEQKQLARLPHVAKCLNMHTEAGVGVWRTQLIVSFKVGPLILNTLLAGFIGTRRRQYADRSRYSAVRSYHLEIHHKKQWEICYRFKDNGSSLDKKKIAEALIQLDRRLLGAVWCS
jgi:hypothetical protein